MNSARVRSEVTIQYLYNIIRRHFPKCFEFHNGIHRGERRAVSDKQIIRLTDKPITIVAADNLGVVLCNSPIVRIGVSGVKMRREHVLVCRGMQA
jgi:hypothetical protein